jgi:hypothetical protein
MLLSNRFKFLFVHIAKTGGTSVRSSLRRLCWRDPLFVPLFLSSRLSHLCDHRIGAKFPRHAPAIAAMEMMSPSFYDSLLKFAFVRNPWDRIVSSYHHFTREQSSILEEKRISDFHDFVRWVVEDSTEYHGPKQVFVAAVRRPQVEHLIDIAGNRIVDFVGRYEQLIDDFAVICDRLRIKPRTLPHKRQATSRKDYRSYYADTTAELVGRCFKRDIDEFGYRFDAPPELRISSASATQPLPADSIDSDRSRSIPFTRGPLCDDEVVAAQQELTIAKGESAC